MASTNLIVDRSKGNDKKATVGKEELKAKS